MYVKARINVGQQDILIISYTLLFRIFITFHFVFLLEKTHHL